MKIKYLLLLAASAVLLIVSGCGSKNTVVNDEPVVTQRDDLDVSQLVGKRPATLSELVNYAAHTQYSSLDSIYNRPPEGMDDFFIKLDEENETLFLAENVNTYVRDHTSLATGLNNGAIRIFGAPQCSAVQTAQAPVNKISWFDGSSYLASVLGDNTSIEVFNLAKCARVNNVSVNGTVSTFAISPRGTWLAAVDSVRRLWVGQSTGKLREIARFRFQPIYVGFSDKEGILFIVDDSGWITLWSPLKGEEIHRFKMDGGPFKKVEAIGAAFNFYPVKGGNFSFDMLSQQKGSPIAKDDSFYLKNGVLSYHSPRKKLSKRVFFRAPAYSVQVSPSRNVFQVSDIDGSQRYYSVKTGQPVGYTVAANDWKDVELGRDTDFDYNGRRFCLAEVIAQREFQRLYCRYIAGKGYYLWWGKVTRPDDFFKSRGMLPVRNGISVDSPVDWRPLDAGRLDIRDMN